MTVKDLALAQDACPICGGSGYLRHEVPVEHADFGHLIPCACKTQAQQQLRQQQSQLEGWLGGCSFRNYQTNKFNQASLQAAREFAHSPRAWLTLHGNFGNGKTHLAAAIVNECQARQIPAIYYTLPDLLDQLRDSFDQNDYSPRFEYLCSVPVLVLDEVDKVKWTDWAIEKVHQLADTRYRRRDELGTVFVLNDDPQTVLLEANDSRLGAIYSRMRDQHSQIIHLNGPDARPLSKILWTAHSDPDANQFYEIEEQGQ